MFYFYNFNIFKKSFFQYLRYVSVLCVIAIICTGVILLNNQYKQQRQLSNRLFNVTEQTIQQCKQSIDSYVNNLYSDKVLLDDFMNFFGNDIEEYLSLQLNDFNLSNTNTFLNSLKMFVENNNFLIKQVSFFKGNNINVIRYDDKGNAKYLFNTTPMEAKFRKDENYLGYYYTKTIFSNTDFNKIIGEVIFVIDISDIVDELFKYKYLDTAVINDDKFISLYNDKNTITESIAKKLLKNNDVSKSYMSNKHFYINSSVKHSYMIITATTITDIIKQNYGMFLLSVFVLIAIFVLIMFIIISKLNSDAHSFENIMNFIKLAENGEFIDINSKSKRDEYIQISIQLNNMGKKINELIEKEYILTRKQQQSIMLALQNQINPHFLYNTLEIIRSRALKNNDIEVSTAIENLGSLYRDIVKGDFNIEIKQEVELLNKYLDIMKFRYQTSFTYQIDIEPLILNCKTIKCWMQPIVENYFKYGFKKDSEFNIILIEGKVIDNYATITFFNNGYPLDDDLVNDINKNFKGNLEIETNSIGLKNVYSRLKLFYREDFSMNIENLQQGGVCITIKFKIVC